MPRRVLAVAGALLLSSAACADPATDATVVMAPSSLTAVTEEVDRVRGTATDWIVAGSSRLVAQLADGAEATLLITADAETMQRAVDDGLVQGPVTVIAHNRLVFAVAPDNPGGITSTDDLFAEQKLVGICAAEVPCGRLAGRFAASVGRVIKADTEEPNVRALALKIARGELDGGLVYATDARDFGLDTIDDEILAGFVNDYQAGVIADRDASGVLAFLLSADGRRLLVDLGFVVP